jgi:hypothetical protein
MLKPINRTIATAKSWSLHSEEGVSQKGPAPCEIHSAFPDIHRQAERSFDEVLDAGVNSISRLFATHINIAVVGVSTEFMSSAFKFFVEFVQNHVTQ